MSRKLSPIAPAGVALAASLAASLLLTACDDLGSALGMSRSNVDDGVTVPTNSTLAIPPDFALKPPRETPKDSDADSTENQGPTDPSIHSAKQ